MDQLKMASTCDVETPPKAEPTRLPRQKKDEPFADYFERLKSFAQEDEGPPPDNPYVLDERVLVEGMSQMPIEDTERILRGSFDRSR